MKLIALFIRWFTGVSVRGCSGKITSRQLSNQRIYFCNHTSHFDFAIVWSILPGELRKNTKAAVAADYWCANKIRRAIISFFGLIPIERICVKRSNNPLVILEEEISKGYSLIVFPEGGRQQLEELGEFKGGIYHLAKSCPQAELVLVYIHNANRILPKGEFLPLPFICSVSVGEPIRLNDNENKKEFLSRARSTLAELRAC